MRSLLELVCIYYRKQAGIEEEEQEVEVRAGAELGWHALTLCCAKVGHYGRVWCGWGGGGGVTGQQVLLKHGYCDVQRVWLYVARDGPLLWLCSQYDRV